jgi:cytochrome c5
MKKVILVIGVTLLGTAGCAQKPGAGEPGAKLLQERCSRCHPLGVKKAHSTKEEWEQTVTKMMKKGAVLSEAEKTVLVDFLVKYYKPN